MFVSLLKVGVKKHSLLYDILAIGPESFDLGLRDILESPSIQKVCRCRYDECSLMTVKEQSFFVFVAFSVISCKLLW